MSSIFPESEEARPAIIRRTVLLPLPEAPSNTKSSPSAISSDTVSTTARPANRLVRPSRTIDIGLSWFLLLLARGEAEQEEEDREGKQGQHGRDRVGVGDVSRLELGEDVEGRRLGLQPQVPGDHHGRAELAQRMGEGQEGSGDQASAQSRQE